MWNVGAPLSRRRASFYGSLQNSYFAATSE
jgi:hypothetical protein